MDRDVPLEAATRVRNCRCRRPLCRNSRADLAGHVQFDPGCNRIENGVITANNPMPPPHGAASCQENVDSGMWVYITDINPPAFWC